MSPLNWPQAILNLLMSTVPPLMYALSSCSHWSLSSNSKITRLPARALPLNRAPRERRNDASQMSLVAYASAASINPPSSKYKNPRRLPSGAGLSYSQIESYFVSNLGAAVLPPDAHSFSNWFFPPVTPTVTDYANFLRDRALRIEAMRMRVFARFKLLALSLSRSCRAT